MSMYESLFRPLLFRLDPELAHALTLYALRLTGVLPPLHWLVGRSFQTPDKPVSVFGLNFRNPVGLAAGYDKDGLAWRSLAALGFGHVEVGTVTLRPQPGNPKPRLFRIPSDRAVINRMGFPGRGAAYLAQRLQGQRPAGMILGINLGKNKDTPNERAGEDYCALLRTFASLGDYLVINVSSPNTVGLRRLQARAYLEDLLAQLREERAALNIRPPILVKLSPDLNSAELDDALAAITNAGMDGIIATNTTLSRDGLNSPLAAESGGLSGAPLTAISLNMVAEISRRTGGKLPVIGVGGVMKPDDARRMLDAGATLVQLYTGLIYAGPALVKRTVRAL